MCDVKTRDDCPWFPFCFRIKIILLFSAMSPWRHNKKTTRLLWKGKAHFLYGKKPQDDNARMKEVGDQSWRYRRGLRRSLRVTRHQQILYYIRKKPREIEKTFSSFIIQLELHKKRLSSSSFLGKRATSSRTTKQHLSLFSSYTLNGPNPASQ